MRKISIWLSLLVVIFIIYWSFYSLMPGRFSKASAAKEEFSTERALEHVKALSSQPHYVGSPGHKVVREYIILTLRKLGLDPQVQEGYTAGGWGNFSKVQNIVARIKGSGNGKALLLMAHYDSAPHSSLGASDDASGVATVLEGIRAFLASGEETRNDIIILITDAEELGLNGAQLFVRTHPWIKNVGVVLNFEARGSGGPSYMLIETNKGNASMIENFAKADPPYPVATSLSYSIYKLLPNDTDLTVFREEGDIQGFNFAFIDDHFDYHTAIDNYERLDRTTLEHQGSYLMPMLRYFANEDLSHLKSGKDHVYFNFPFVHLVYYPFSWIVPMLGFAIFLFVLLIVFAKKRGAISFSKAGKGFIPFIASLVVTGIAGSSWSLISKIYPNYIDMSHGFTYNGYLYIYFYSFLTVGIYLILYARFDQLKATNLIVAPLFFWLLLCTAAAVFLRGAAFFIIPVYFALLSFFILIRKQKPSPLLHTILAVPGLLILSPLTAAFPVALGLTMMTATCIFATFIMGLLIPVLEAYHHKKLLALVSFSIALVFLVIAHFKSDSNPDRPKPTSLVYFLDADSGEAVWATNNIVTDGWIETFIGKEKKSYARELKFNSKYQKGFSYAAPAPVGNVAAPLIEVLKDTILGSQRKITISAVPQRRVDLLEVTTGNATIYACSVNGIAMEEKFVTGKKRGNRLLTHYISDNDSTILNITVSKDDQPELTFFEVSRDLLSNAQFKVPPRPANAIPYPFIVNDAIIVKKRIKL
jgi:hypothetical protein